MKKILCISLFLLLTVLCTCALAASSGTCGESLTWTLDDNGTLTISGTGKMTSNWWWENPDFGWDKQKIMIVMIENGVTEISYDAFGSCPNLTSIFIPASVTSIARYDEQTQKEIATNCPKLKEYVVASGNQTYCTKDGVLFSKDMKYLYRCPQGKTGKYIVPEQVEKLYGAVYESSSDHGRMAAFSGCSKLSEIVLLHGVNSIGSYAFSGCSAMTSITISDSVGSIGDGAFSGCSSLKSIMIPDSVESIGSYAFENCTSLTSITIPKSVKWFGNSGFGYEDGVFYGCSGLVNVTLAQDAWFNTFYNCSSLKIATFLDGAKRIGGDAFYGCTALETLIIPDSLTEIIYGGKDEENPYPFYDCKSLTNITISARNKSAITFFKGHGFTKALNVYDIPMTDCKINVNADQAVYTGKPIEPKITVKYLGKELDKGTDYTVEYKNNKNVGKASVTITGQGRCIGKKTLYFIINPPKVRLSSLKSGENGLTVKWKKGSGIDGYEIQYSLKKSFKNAKTVRISKVETTSTVLEGLKAKKTYYVRIRTFKKAGGKKYYSEWSKVLSGKTE